MLAGLSAGTTRLRNFSTGADPHSTLNCMRALGAKIEEEGDGTLAITGVSGHFVAPRQTLDCGNSGSTMRMLSGLLAAHPYSFTLVGDQSLSKRPMQRVGRPIERFFVNSDHCGFHLTDGHAPITLTGGTLKGVLFEEPIASAQVKTAILFAGMQASGTTTVSEAVRTRDHTEQALGAFGIHLARRGDAISVEGGQVLHAIDATVPGDLSSAAFFLCAALLFPDSQLVLDALGMNPTRSALLDTIVAFGARIKVLNIEEHHGELVGTIQVNAHTDPRAGQEPVEITGALTAQLIDEIPVLAAVAPFTSKGLRVRDARELRVKESDRIALVVKNLRRMGAEVTEHEDGLDVPGGQHLHGAEIDSGDDHRIAMAFAVAALRTVGETQIHGAEVAAISFPEFFANLKALAG